ncbi:capsular biosynthesis protein [Perlabentimonas gracilis]|uniref:capsular biosynthesis protein n=1 Tax=Perlabentimonas gracilis TaxID=2715279 RepID=UPI00140816CA|nr:capsular biosynthesis protein [Perlabentimonas gracilis]NHB68932.1 capsular biosynthesis protein [Perlabentimonas gracilis]
MKTQSNCSSSQPIDAVVAWVDGENLALAAKRQKYLTDTTPIANSSADPTRFASVNEIKYCVLSIIKFAPFVRNIFIVTDKVDPQIYDDVKRYYPERLSSIRIVDHTEIFEGFEEFLPTFNSITIGNMIWRIKDLANNFVYFNDDTFLVRSINPSDWFVGDRPVIRGHWAGIPLHRMLWNKLLTTINKNIRGQKNYQPRASFHMGQWNSARLAGYKWRYFTHSHTPHTVGKQVVADFFAKNLQILRKNLAYRFRNPSQFTFIALSNHLQLIGGNSNIAKPNLIYMQPHNRYNGYIEHKIKLCEQNPSIKYICVQSLDLCSPKEQNRVLGWLEKIIKPL